MSPRSRSYHNACQNMYQLQKQFGRNPTLCDVYYPSAYDDVGHGTVSTGSNSRPHVQATTKALVDRSLPADSTTAYPLASESRLATPAARDDVGHRTFGEGSNSWPHLQATTEASVDKFPLADSTTGYSLVREPHSITPAAHDDFSLGMVGEGSNSRPRLQATTKASVDKFLLADSTTTYYHHENARAVDPLHVGEGVSESQDNAIAATAQGAGGVLSDSAPVRTEQLSPRRLGDEEKDEENEANDDDDAGMGSSSIAEGMGVRLSFPTLGTPTLRIPPGPHLQTDTRDEPDMRSRLHSKRISLSPAYDLESLRRPYQQKELVHTATQPTWTPQYPPPQLEERAQHRARPVATSTRHAGLKGTNLAVVAAKPQRPTSRPFQLGPTLSDLNRSGGSLSAMTATPSINHAAHQTPSVAPAFSSTMQPLSKTANLNNAGSQTERHTYPTTRHHAQPATPLQQHLSSPAPQTTLPDSADSTLSSTELSYPMLPTSSDPVDPSPSSDSASSLSQPRSTFSSTCSTPGRVRRLVKDFTRKTLGMSLVSSSDIPKPPSRFRRGSKSWSAAGAGSGSDTLATILEMPSPRVDREMNSSL